ncbi:MAG TPA: response regulator [Terriglobales bacterium]
MSKETATVLCIDDEQTALQLRQTVLESAGYRVLTAKSGALGIQVFKSEPIHAVVLDYWMADMNGMQVAREIRRLNPSVPIIILSAYGELLDESLGIADIWIRKGEEDPQYLLARLDDLLKSRVKH